MLQESKILKHIVAEMKEAIFKQWTVSRDPNSRETAWAFYQSIGMFEQQLDATVNSVVRAELME